MTITPNIPPGNYVLPPIVGRHEAFITTSSLAFVVLFAERGLYAHLADGQRSSQAAALIIGLSALVIFAGFLASFHLPPRLRKEDDQSVWLPHALNFLMGQWAISALCVVAASLVTLGLYVYLVYPNLLAIAGLVRDVFLYMVLGAMVYHGFVVSIRYLGLLYQTGGADKLKVIAFEAGAAAFIVVFSLYQHTVDLVPIWMARPEHGLLVLHLTVRDIWLAFMVGFIFIWQIGRAGDH